MSPPAIPLPAETGLPNVDPLSPASLRRHRKQPPHAVTEAADEAASDGEVRETGHGRRVAVSDG
jgi:hypothetical protein